MTGESRLKALLTDGIHVIWISILGFLLSAYMLKGNVLDTSYADWMYHAFRAQSLMQHGLLSWDSIWNNGISYWRGYQFLPAVITALYAKVLNIEAAKAMIHLSVILYIALRVSIYIALRMMGQSRAVSIMGAVISFSFSGFVLELKDYSIAYAVVLLPVLLGVWHKSHIYPKLRPVFAALIGLSIYVHPLLALGLGGVWLMHAVIKRDEASPAQLVRELIIMAACASFYIYSMQLPDSAYIAQYQLAKDFSYIVYGAFKVGPLYYLMLVIAGLAVAFRSDRFAMSIKILYWFSLILFVMVLIHQHTSFLDVLNRFQIMRLLYFIVIGNIIVFAHVLGSYWGRLQTGLKIILIGIIVGVCVGQALVDSNIYGSVPRTSAPDPVGTYFKTTQPTGTVFLAETTAASYYHPKYRFINGYNDQLLPQLIGIRYREFLSVKNPNAIISESSARMADSYARLLGVSHVFLPSNSPAITPLIEFLGYKKAGVSAGPRFNMVVLTPPWTPTAAAIISEDEYSALSKLTINVSYLDEKNYFAELDRVVGQTAAIKSDVSTSVRAPQVTFPRPDQIRITITPLQQTQYLYLAQSFSKDWQVKGASISPTAEGLMLVEVPAGTQDITLSHTWGLAPWIALAGGLLALGLISYDVIRLKGENNA